MTPRQEFDELARDLVGETIGDVWRGFGSAVFVEFGQLTPRNGRDGSRASPQGQVSLCIGISWRIQDARAVLCGSVGEDALWEPSFALLRRSAIDVCHLFGALPEIDIATTGGVHILSFATTDGQPGWYMVDRRNGPARWYSICGGQLHLGDGSEPAFG